MLKYIDIKQWSELRGKFILQIRINYLKLKDMIIVLSVVTIIIDRYEQTTDYRIIYPFSLLIFQINVHVFSRADRS